MFFLSMTFFNDSMVKSKQHIKESPSRKQREKHREGLQESIIDYRFRDIGFEMTETRKY